MKLGVHDLMLRENGKSNEEFFEDTKKIVLTIDIGLLSTITTKIY